MIVAVYLVNIDCRRHTINTFHSRVTATQPDRVISSYAATTPNIAERCSFAHTKFAQQIQFTVGHLADFDSAYFSESESVKLVYITDIARFTRLETRLNSRQSSAICRQHRCRGRCGLETTAYCLPIPVSRL